MSEKTRHTIFSACVGYSEFQLVQLGKGVGKYRWDLRGNVYSAEKQRNEHVQMREVDVARDRQLFVGIVHLAGLGFGRR